MSFWLHIVVFCWLVIYTANAEEVQKISEEVSPDFVEVIIEKSNSLNPKGDSKYEQKKESLIKEAEKVKNENANNELIAKGIKGVGDGLIQLVGGISSGSWQDMLLGSLGVVGTLASLAGPTGAAFANILSLVSMVFGIVGASKAKESQDGMLKRVIDDALIRARADELRAEAEGLKKAISSIQNSINQFREENSISKNQATELYNQAFRGLTFFGLLKYQIDKYCDCAVENPNNTVQLSKAKQNSDRCLEFLNLYADLSILRQLLIADMASLVGSVGEIGTAKNLISFTEKEKISDKEIFFFLLDPINYKNQRFCIAQFYGVPGKYLTLQAYLARLSKASIGEIATQHVVICSQKQLLGLCLKLEKKNYNFANKHGWASNIKSVYVSDDLYVRGFSEVDQKGVEYGPIPGPTVIGHTASSNSWKSIEIGKPTKKVKHVRICEKEKLSQDGRCDMLAAIDFPDLKSFNKKYYYKSWYGSGGIVEGWKYLSCVTPFTYNGQEYKRCVLMGTLSKTYQCAVKNVKNEYKECGFPQTWSEKIVSISIPENVQVMLYAEEDFKGKCFGPFFGANTIDKICENAKAKSMKISTSNLKTSEMVKICSGASFSQMCDYLETNSYNTLVIHGCDWSKMHNKIKSMRVPGGLAVSMWTEENFGGKELGPYIGPVSVSVVDGGEPDSLFQIKSLKIENKIPFAVNSVKKKN